MNAILEQIIRHKKREVAAKKELFPIAFLETSPVFNRKTNSLSQSLKTQGCGIIAEHKRRSPSQPVIHFDTPLQDIIKHYEKHEVAGISVLTDSHFFGGSLEDLNQSRMVTELPLLRKDFVIAPYQLVEAKAHGADVVLLIAAVLDAHELKTLTEQAHELDLEVLIEIHHETELEKAVVAQPELIGVNNRNLNTFVTDLEVSERLAGSIPEGIVKISESGIKSLEDMERLRQAGFQGFLIGETFMRDFQNNKNLQQYTEFLKQ